MKGFVQRTNAQWQFENIWPFVLVINNHVFLKQLMQRASEASTSWDDQLPHELADEYLKWRSNVISLKDVKLQQFFLLDGIADRVELHLFCDASERTCAGCLDYNATDSHGMPNSSLLVAKTKVPHENTVCSKIGTCAASLGSWLFQSVFKSIDQTSVVCEETVA